MTFKNEKNRNIAIVSKDANSFLVYMGYDNETDDAYGNFTITNRKVYKSEKMAIKKAQEYVA